jgi:hypothetical protein
MIYEDIAKTFEEYLQAQWVLTPIVFDNAPANLQDREPWVSFRVVPATSENRTIGTGETLKEGFAFLQIFTPLNSGTREGQKLVDEYLALLENKDFLTSSGTLFTLAGDYARVGDEGNGWFLMTSTIRFQAT